MSKRLIIVLAVIYGLMLYLYFTKQTTVSPYLLVVLGVVFLGTILYSIWHLHTATPDMYKGMKEYVSPEGLTVMFPAWLAMQGRDIIFHVLEDIDTVYRKCTAILEGYYYKQKTIMPSADDITIAIMRSINVFPHDASGTGFAAGDTTCGKNIFVRICLRSEEEGSLEVMHSHDGYLRPLEWEMKNVFNCTNNVGPWDFKPPDKVLTALNETMKGIRFPREGVFGERFTEV